MECGLRLCRSFSGTPALNSCVKGDVWLQSEIRNLVIRLVPGISTTNATLVIPEIICANVKSESCQVTSVQANSLT